LPYEVCRNCGNRYFEMPEVAEHEHDRHVCSNTCSIEYHNNIERRLDMLTLPLPLKDEGTQKGGDLKSRGIQFLLGND